MRATFEGTEAVTSQLLGREDSFAEFKDVRFGQHDVVSPNSDDMAREMVAFAKAEGAERAGRGQ